jgi:hypothetical protein
MRGTAPSGRPFSQESTTVSMIALSPRVCLALSSLLIVFSVGDAQAQHLRGRIIDSGGSPLPGASVVAEATDGRDATIGVAADRQGRFGIDVPSGEYRVVGSFVGFRSATRSVSIAGGDTLDVLLTLHHDVLLQDDIIVESRRATPSVSPVTFTNLTPRELDVLPAMKDLPVLLSTLPSITVHSENGNGIGYSTMRMRGFDQRRIAVSINGIPQNDPEDFNVFWINFFDIQGPCRTSRCSEERTQPSTARRASAAPSTSSRVPTRMHRTLFVEAGGRAPSRHAV